MLILLWNDLVVNYRLIQRNFGKVKNERVYMHDSELTLLSGEFNQKWLQHQWKSTSSNTNIL